MISVAAELAEMHPQTLRMYERRGLIRPRRSSKSTRLYSLADVERLRRIQQLVAECGLNLAGVERVLEMEEQLADAAAPAGRAAGRHGPPGGPGAGRAGSRAPQLPQRTGAALQPRAGDRRHRPAPRSIVERRAFRRGRTSRARGRPAADDCPAAKEQPCANHPNARPWSPAAPAASPSAPTAWSISAVGIKCKECATTAALGPGDPQDRQAAAGDRGRSRDGTALGFAYYYILGSIGFFFLFIFVAAGIGYLVGEVVAGPPAATTVCRRPSRRQRATLLGLPASSRHRRLHQLGVNWNTVVFTLSGARGHQLGGHALRRVPRLEPQPLTATAR